MIEISQKEFEDRIQEVIEGKTTRKQLIKELKIDRNTLNNKIQELVVYNPELYKKFIEKFPYRPREYSHIDYEAIIIDILKKGYKRREWDDVYEIDSRTINRKINEIQNVNPSLVELYKKVSSYRKKQKQVPIELQQEIDNLEARAIYICGIYDKKREEILVQEKAYNEKLLEGKSVVEASKELGRGRVSKVIDTLNRIEIETMTREKKGNIPKEMKMKEKDKYGGIFTDDATIS